MGEFPYGGMVENVTRRISRVQSAFRQQAPGFGEAGLTLGWRHLLQWIVESLPLAPQMRTLDVAAGTGHVSRVVAPHVRSVTAVDVTPAMLHEARAEAAEARLGNLHLVQADAGRLPFADGRFDLVMCRLALHHFADPVVEVAEMARVTRRSGTLAIIDLLSPDDVELAARYNRFERMRDPSHTRALTGAELRDLLEAIGRPVDNWSVREVDVDLDPWFDLTRSPYRHGKRSRRRSSVSTTAGRPPGCGRASAEGGCRSCRRGPLRSPARAIDRLQRNWQAARAYSSPDRS